MATNNKFIVERTNVLAADVTVGVSYAALDSGDFGWYGKAGETYEFEARVVYSAAAATDGAAFSITASAFVSEYNTDATTLVRTACVAIDTPDHGSASVALATGLNQAFVVGVITPSADGFIGVSGIAENASSIIAKGTLSTLKWRRVFVGDNE
jgi:predicted GNAT superfamily acetyltransferase